MSRTKENIRQQGSGGEMLLARVVYTETGYPASQKDVEGCYGTRISPASKGPDWWWIGATPGSAANIRRRGLRAVGTLLTSWIPPQTAPEILPSPTEVQVPAVGTQEHAEAMLLESRRRSDGGEPHEPLELYDLAAETATHVRMVGRSR